MALLGSLAVPVSLYCNSRVDHRGSLGLQVSAPLGGGRVRLTRTGGEQSTLGAQLKGTVALRYEGSNTLQIYICLSKWKSLCNLDFVFADDN